jgi:hypothetical protein
MRLDGEPLCAVVRLVDELDPVPAGLIERVQRRVAAEVAPPQDERQAA